MTFVLEVLQETCVSEHIHPVVSTFFHHCFQKKTASVTKLSFCSIFWELQRNMGDRELVSAEMACLFLKLGRQQELMSEGRLANGGSTLCSLFSF